MLSENRRFPERHARAEAATATETRSRRLIRLALRSAGNGTGGTPETIIKLRSTPLNWLITGKKIGPEEMRAAHEICTAFFALSGGLMFKPLVMERRDPSHRGGDWPAGIAMAVQQYQSWAKHWSIRAKQGDPTMEILIAAVVDERPFSVIEADIGIRHGLASKATAAGLRDYAARAGWVEGARASAWMSAAIFKVSHPDAAERKLAVAVARARCE